MRQYGSAVEPSASEMKEEGERSKAEGLIAQLALETQALKEEEKEINGLLKM